VDLLQLEHFLAVVEARSFTRAAERVSRTQSAVSQSIKKLEEEVGMPLLARGVQGVTLTEAGQLLAEYARRMVQARDEAMRQIGILRDMDLEARRSAVPEPFGAPLPPSIARR
jgi:DNA-binding transcriptional LysR family regulator